MALSTREQLAKKVAWISVISNILLTIGKLVIGWAANSDAVFADGIHSAADVFASVIVLFVIKIANKPADLEHPYGHGKAEVIVSGIVGIVLFAVSLYVVYEAIIGLFHPITAPNILAMWIAIISYGAKEYLYRYSMKIAKEQKSKAIEAIAFDHKADIVASIAAAVGVILSIIGDKFDIKFLLFGDKVASIIVAYLIFKISKEMLKEAFDILLERNIDSAILKDYESIIASFSEVKRIDRLRAREHGHYVLVDLRISIDHDKTIKEGHDLSREIKKKLMKKHDNIEEVLIHLNPYY
ncbi:cation diffusion facilitator family transporter [Niallia taxi]|uniref:Cation transporter n=1 Tax=Niallia taxi TaxID=2499688 RepID=A0A3S2TWK9_9BACI|nr:cation diffusion facilitator family transporter [Niallia taxi]MCM3215862.1 cation diffusion facilitator family transporter [Niallia taxi]MCT2342876.1 cation diffusion facilitator family transporter [Niallia taxi]MDE5051130.1 cation diffusion facilitator family transporter [Niallia taxi]MDK8639018.1 cation diffusion facilitator family transporter [Niallia taxi]MED3962558.1 cation diffusion facilitator family transporter [Niallia taxi]